MTYQDIFGPVTTRSHIIGDFETFILSNIPYGQVQPQYIQWGAVEYDGPHPPYPAKAGFPGSKPALQWHFGGVPYPITKAVRIRYTYRRTFDGSNDTVTGMILLGFQHGLNTYLKPQPVPFVQKLSDTFLYRACVGVTGDPSSQVWGSPSAVLASEAGGVLTKAFPDNLATLVKNELPKSVCTAPAFTALTTTPICVDFDGPAQDSDSHDVFPYTFATLLNDPQKYSQLIFWYFAGQA